MAAQAIVPCAQRARAGAQASENTGEESEPDAGQAVDVDSVFGGPDDEEDEWEDDDWGALPPGPPSPDEEGPGSALGPEASPRGSSATGAPQSGMPASTAPASRAPGSATVSGGWLASDDPLPNVTAVTLHGAWQLRLEAMSRLPLASGGGTAPSLGQRLWSSGWLRLTGTVALRPAFRLVGQLDVFDGLYFGDTTRDVSAARWARDEEGDGFGGEGIEPRWLYAEWQSSIGRFRAGLQPSHWGLGLLANDGDHPPPFGDYHFGTRHIRLRYDARPGGDGSPLHIDVAGDLVYEDPLAELVENDHALQAVLALYYEREALTAGAYLVYRAQRSARVGTTDDGSLDVWIADLYARWRHPEPSGGHVELAVEGFLLGGDSTLGAVRRDVLQGAVAGRMGRYGETLDVVLEIGFAAGDDDVSDGTQRRALMHPDHRVGLLLFPEVLAWSTARSATLAANDTLGRPAPGSEGYPTEGGVAGASYVFQYAVVRPLSWLELRLGWVWGRATADLVDPYRQAAEGARVGVRGGDARSRDLGFEVDGAALVRFQITGPVAFVGGIEGAVLAPGRAFDDADGDRLGALGLGRLRLGLTF